MRNSVSPLELYEAARETCLRLYVANGGDPRDRWDIKPHVTTAAIARHPLYDGTSHWTLCMPAFPLNVRLPRWKADLVAAYTVHELLHALWTDWAAVKESYAEKLANLCNAIEDCRIEAKASRGGLAHVSEARRLLMALNDWIIRRAMNSPGFSFNDPRQFSFVLGVIIFEAKLGYVSPFPADWRQKIRQEWLPLIEHALARFDALQSTGDVLTLAKELRAMAEAVRQTVTGTPGTPTPSTPREAEIVEDVIEAPDTPPASAKGEGEGEGESDDSKAGEADAKGEGESDDSKAGEADAKGEGEGEGESDDSKAGEADAKGGEFDGLDDDDDNGEIDGDVSENEGAEGGSRRAPSEGEGEGEGEGAPSEDVTDATQSYDDKNLADLAEQTAKEAGAGREKVARDTSALNEILEARPLQQTEDGSKRGNVAAAGAFISSPAKVRRHLTMAVKSPERVAKERRQVSGRLDLRDIVGLSTARPDVFSRRLEEEGKEAAVTLLLDISGSMAGVRMMAAKALALHMGDALKAAGVKFEIAAFDDVQLVLAKPLAKGWNAETKRAVAGLRPQAGTSMLPAIKACAQRLMKTPGVTRRILLALTDGADSYSEAANREQCAFWRRRGVEVIGIALSTWGVEGYFDGRCVNVRDPLTLSEDGLKALVRVLDAGAPRMG